MGKAGGASGRRPAASGSAGPGGDEAQPTLERRLAAWMLAGIDGAGLWRALVAETPPVDAVSSLPPPVPARGPAGPPPVGGAGTGPAAWPGGGTAAARGMREAGDPAGE